MLLWALRDSNPYSYYMVLRWTVSVFAIYLALIFHGIGSEFRRWALILAAIIYNPLIKTRFERDTWEMIDVATLLLFTMTALPFFRRTSH